ncbi:OmpA family protein [Devosia algicola]|uniref:OmpA family protein n=1 Tax=Devosia algicola TaxID=3026418 RepID=A0ABY7YSN8_9HYPH|nr:OmpA family protein [Devosia algicola]WDR03984.1 OmpA family protein [Devosia algicola]
MQAQIDIYNDAIADILAGGDRAGADAKMAAAQQQIDALCQQANFPDTAACLANYGMELPAPPPAAAGAVEQPAAPAETPAAAPVEAPAEPTETIEALPEGVTQDQVAPVLDSAKDEQAAPADANRPAADAAPEAPAEPPPADDKASQANFAPDAAEIQPVNEEQGERIEVQQLAPQEMPQNVTVINQTNVTTTNNTTNNVTNNTIDNSTNTTAVQQNNVEASFGNTLTQVILQVGSQLIVENRGQDTDRFLDADGQDEIYYDRLGNGRVRETIVRADGWQIVTVRNRNGDVLRRSKIDPDGREYVLAYFDDRYDEDLLEWRDPGQDLPPLRLNIPVDQYVIDARNVDEEQVATFFRQPPVEQVARLYSIDEVKRSARVRDSVRKLEVGGLTFDTGAASISRDQVGALSKVAAAMTQLLRANPAETFLIEGHTDAVGSEISNLQLSDLRAATVARVLTDFYQIPPENLATQGYGERYLKIRTEMAERANRRVTIRRITPLVTPVASAR